MFTLSISTSGAAFTIESSDEDNGTPLTGPELARLLREIADSVQYAEVGAGPVIDANGNNVGRWQLTSD